MNTKRNNSKTKKNVKEFKGVSTQLCLLRFFKYCCWKSWKKMWNLTKILKSLWSSLCEKCPNTEFIWSEFPIFGLNTEIYRVNLCIKSKYGKMRTRKTPYLKTFRAVHFLFFKVLQRSHLITKKAELSMMDLKRFLAKASDELIEIRPHNMNLEIWRSELSKFCAHSLVFCLFIKVLFSNVKRLKSITDGRFWSLIQNFFGIFS